jgi:pseudouridine synthase
VDLERDVVTLDDKPVRARRRIYLVLYKPKGYITSYGDPQRRPTVYHLIAGLGEFVVPVGRLDQDSSGLLLMTNDTAFAEFIMNPDHQVPKTYLVKAATLLTDDQLEQLRRGVDLDDGPTRPTEVRRIRDSRKHTFLEMTVREGRYHEVRRMLDAVGSRALKLVRTAIGPLAIGKLEIGRYRELTPEEVKSLVPGQRKRRPPKGRPPAP